MKAQDRHFIESWTEQREGPKWKYYFQYSVAWSVVIFLSLFFLLLLVGGRGTGGKGSFAIVASISIIVAIIATHFIYTSNEKRFLDIHQRENL